MMRWREYIVSLDWIMISCVSLLVVVGLAMFLSATYTDATISPFFIRQSIAWGMSLVAFVILSRVRYHSLRVYVPTLYVIGIAVLLFVSVTGRVIRGTVSRLELFGFQLQPSELVKIALVLALAWLFSKYKRPSFAFILQALVVTAVPLVLVALEPDLGVAFLMLALFAGVVFYVGTSWRVIGVFCLIGALLGLGAWHWVLQPYQKDRIASFVNPASDPLGSGYNVKQSIVALGSGGVLGRGLGHGPQSQLKFLPERHTDFIFASIGEELGFVGILVVLSLYTVLLWRILKVAGSTNDMFGQILCIGAFILLLTSFLVNAGMNMGLLPVTGIPLPFVSYGGSNLIATWMLIALVQSVRIHSGFARKEAANISYI